MDNKNYDFKKIGERIKKERKRKGLSLEELGFRVNVSRQTLSQWEKGAKESKPSLLDFLRLCNEFGCDLQFLLCENECRTKDLQGVHDFTGLSAEAIELLSGLSKDPDGIEIVREIDSLIKDRRIIRRLHDVRKVSDGIIHSVPSLDSISALRGMLEVALLDLSTQVHVYASDSLNAEEAKYKLSRMEKPERKKWVY